VNFIFFFCELWPIYGGELLIAGQIAGWECSLLDWLFP
jgi:hypothetical protein